MAVNKVAAAYLAYFAYIDDALEVIPASDFKNLLAQVPPGAANGPWTLCWGPAVNDGVLGYVAQGADGSYALAFRGTDVDGSSPVRLRMCLRTPTVFSCCRGCIRSGPARP